MTINEFARKNWRTLVFSAAAISIAAVCVFFPPAILVTGIFALAGTSGMALFGAAAVGVATAVVTSVAAFTAGLLATGFAIAMNWLSKKFKAAHVTTPERFDVNSGDSSDDEHSDDENPDDENPDMSASHFIAPRVAVSGEGGVSAQSVAATPTTPILVTSVVPAHSSRNNRRSAISPLDQPEIDAAVLAVQGRASLAPSLDELTLSFPGPAFEGNGQPSSPLASASVSPSEDSVAVPSGTPIILTRSTPLEIPASSQYSQTQAAVESALLRTSGLGLISMSKQSAEDLVALSEMRDEANAGGAAKKY